MGHHALLIHEADCPYGQLAAKWRVAVIAVAAVVEPRGNDRGSIKEAERFAASV